jgi:hypothetical protein
MLWRDLMMCLLTGIDQHGRKEVASLATTGMKELRRYVMSSK